MFTDQREAAIEDFTRMITQWPANPKGFTSRADARARAGDLQGAVNDYSSAISINPQHPYAIFQRGRLHAQLNDFPATIQDFTVHMNISPDDRSNRLSALLNRGRAKHATGDLAGAITDLTEAIALEIDDPIFAPLYRGRVKLDAGDPKGAIEDFTIALNAFPGLTNAYRHRADVQALLGDHQGALDDRQRYQQLGGHDLPAYL